MSGRPKNKRAQAPRFPPECNYQYFEDKWMRGTIDTDEFILALGTIDLGELPLPQKPKREVPSLFEPVNKFCRKILREIKNWFATSLPSEVFAFKP